MWTVHSIIRNSAAVNMSFFLFFPKTCNDTNDTNAITQQNTEACDSNDNMRLTNSTTLIANGACCLFCCSSVATFYLYILWVARYFSRALCPPLFLSLSISLFYLVFLFRPRPLSSLCIVVPLLSKLTFLFLSLPPLFVFVVSPLPRGICLSFYYFFFFVAFSTGNSRFFGDIHFVQYQWVLSVIEKIHTWYTYENQLHRNIGKNRPV